MATARTEADFVVVSLHWGIHMVESVIADYQRVAGHALIDAGADAIIGHHPHILKGVELHRGKPIFYSLGNFAIEQPHIWDPAIVETASFRHLVSLNPSWTMESVYMLPPDTRLTGLAELEVDKQGIAAVRFRPAYIADDSAPVMLEADDLRFGAVRDYLARISASGGFATSFELEGNALRIR